MIMADKETCVHLKKWARKNTKIKTHIHTPFQKWLWIKYFGKIGNSV